MNLFGVACAAHGIHEPVYEYRFHPTRKWRFDYAWPESMVALEVQGGIFTNGRHVRAARLLGEHEKLNEAACAGWRVLFCIPQHVANGSIFPVIKRAISITQGASHAQ